MTDLQARLLAILKEEPFHATARGVWTNGRRIMICPVGPDAQNKAADLNAHYRLKKLTEEIAKALDKEATAISNSTHCGSENDELRAAANAWRAMHIARKFILALGDDNDHSS